MAEEPSKKPIIRATVPKVDKEIPTPIEMDSSKISIGTNLLFLLLLILVGGLIYMAIFKKKDLEEFLAISTFSKSTPTLVVEDTLETASKSEYNDNEINTFIGEDNSSPEPNTVEKSGSKIVYPPGSKFYLVMGTFVFYPYAVKYNDKMKVEGYASKILTSGTDRKYYRIYLEKSDDIAAIRQKRDNLKATKGLNVWVYAEK